MDGAAFGARRLQQNLAHHGSGHTGAAPAARPPSEWPLCGTARTAGSPILSRSWLINYRAGRPLCVDNGRRPVDRDMTDIERRAQELVAAHLAGRHLPSDIRAAIEQAVAIQMRDGFTATMEAELHRFIDTCAEPGPATDGATERGPDDDDGRSTSVDVHWTTLR